MRSWITSGLADVGSADSASATLATTAGLAAAAVAVAERGWAVFPCRRGDKRPAIDHWEQRSSADPAHVAGAWRDRWPRANIGIACGPSQLVVVDLDTPAHGSPATTMPARAAAGSGGRDVLAKLAEEAGVPWPDTYCVRTPSGGMHMYFSAGAAGSGLRNSAGRVGPMVDIRAAGGYIVAAGSVVRGRPYESVTDAPLASLPAWLAALARPQKPATGPRRETAGDPSGSYQRLRGIIQTVLDSAPGTRNGRLYWAACRAAELIRAGTVDRATAEHVLLVAAMEAGLAGGEPEARRTIASGLGRL
jgi:hypothetical protein